MSLFEHFISHETITCNEKDPPWMNKQSKKLIVDVRQRMLNPNVLDKTDAFQTKSQSSVTFFTI